MDDETNKLLLQILIVQQEQAALLKRYLPPLWTKIRFSLLAMLILMTVLALGMGMIAYKTNGIRSAAPPTTIPLPPPVQQQPSRPVLPDSLLDLPSASHGNTARRLGSLGMHFAMRGF